MKLIYKKPIIYNLVHEYRNIYGPIFSNKNSGIIKYHEWLKQFGFSVPVRGDYLEFPDDFSDQQITAFILRWS